MPGFAEGNISFATQKIDSLATEGLAGTNNSLAYRVHEIEKHFHSLERWFGSDGDGTGSTANNMTEWRLTAGTSDAYGAEAQMLGANDINASDFDVTPVKFDIHKIMVTDSNQNDRNYIIQFWGGVSTFGAATLISEIPYRTGSSVAEVVPVEMQMGRQVVANKIWGRCKCETDSKYVDILIGVHVYAG